MITSKVLTPEIILNIPVDEPERLFEFKESIKQHYYRLCVRYHPDKNKDSNADEVFSHIQELYKRAQEKIANDLWNPPGMLEIKGKKGFVRIVYRKKHPFELGTMYIGERLVSYVIDKKHEDLVIRGLRAVGTIRYPSEDFRHSLEQYFPKIEHYVESEGHIVVCMRKDPTEVLLSDLVDHLGGKLDPRHACWVLSSLFNLCSFLEVNKMTINGLTEKTIFVSPNRHTVSLLGGWWYAVPYHEKLNILPPEVFKMLPRSIITEKRARYFLDLECVRAIGKYAMGDRSGSTLRMNSEVPTSVASFLMLPSGSRPIEEYKAWVEALTAHGPRKFVKLDISFNDVYPKLEH